MLKNKFGNKKNPVFIIAEAGVNHDGKLDLAKRLVDVAKDAGADAIKFQNFHAEEIVIPETEKAYHQTRAGEKTQYEMLKNLELSDDDFRSLKKYCDNKGIEFISSPYDIKSARLLKELGVKRFKVPSAEIINKPLLEEIAKYRKQVILSTGMANMDEIQRAISLLTYLGSKNITLLHATTAYPASYEQVNLNAMLTLKEEFGLPTGYSDHTLGIEIPVMAASLGAEVIEKHFTLDRAMQGPDHFASLEPDELKKMVSAIRNVEKAFGSSTKHLTEDEKKNIGYMRRSVHASRDIKKGERVFQNSISIKRPYDGAEPWDMDAIIGREIKRDVKKDEPVRLEDFL